MSRRTKKVVWTATVLLAFYVMAYCLRVQIDYELTRVGYLPEVRYRPWDGGVVRGLFWPAQLVDEIYVRPGQWKIRDNHPHASGIHVHHDLEVNHRVERAPVNCGSSSRRYSTGRKVRPVSDIQTKVEKHTYQECNALGLPVPRLLDFCDTERKLRIEYVPGTRPDTPCREGRLLVPVLSFYDQFRNIGFPDGGVALHKMDESCVHKYRLDQLQFIFPEEKTWTRLDTLYESFLRDIPYFTLPFDRILHNALLGEEGLYFVDFEWTIAGPHEFTLARIAVEFNRYDDTEILSRLDDLDLYHLFLLHFYMYGREPKSIYRYMQSHLKSEALRELFCIVNAGRYAHETWCSRESRKLGETA